MTQAPGRAGWPILFAVIGLACLVFTVFWPVLGFVFLDLDVPAQALENPSIRGLTVENLKHIFTTWGSGGTAASYYPVRTLTYAIDYQIWGLDPARFEPINGFELTINGFKLTNVLIHLASVLLVFWLILRLFRWPSTTGQSSGAWSDLLAATFPAAVFAVHPVVVEPVAWVAGREELLMTLGVLGCLHFYLTARRLEEAGGNTGKAVVCFTLATFCCLAACLSNAVGAVIPLLVVAWDLLTLTRSKLGRILWATSALWVIGVVTFVIKRLSAGKDLLGRPLDLEAAPELSAAIQRLGYGNDIIVTEATATVAERLMLILNVYWLNVKSVLWPADLGIFYQPVNTRSFLETGVILGVLAVGLTCLALWLFRRRKLLLFGLVWFGLALGPAAQIMPHHIHRADRFLYLPLVGLAVALGMGLRPLGNALKHSAALTALIGVGVLGLLALDIRSARQVHTWQNTMSIWENCVKVSPESSAGHRALAKTLADAEQFDRVVKHYKIALRINFYDVKALNEFAAYLATCRDKQRRDYPLAISLAEWAVELSHGKHPDVVHNLALAYNNLAVDLADRGQFHQAMENYDKACRTDPGYAAPLFNLALLLATRGDQGSRRVEEAVRLAEQACRMADPLAANHLMILAVAHAQAGHSDEAINTTQRAIRLAEAEGNAQLAESIRGRLELYRSRDASGPDAE